MKRLNITLPEDLVKELENIPNKSRFIAEALRERLEKIKRQKLDELLIKGYKSTYKEDFEINKDWESITLEGWS